MKHRTDYPGSDLRTKEQWKKLKMIPRDGEEPVRLWCNFHHQRACDYFYEKQVREMSPEEKELIKEENKEKRRQRKIHREKLLLEEEYVKEEKRKRIEDENIMKARWEIGNELSHLLLREGLNNPVSDDTIYSEKIFIDVETTGLSTRYDEILQLSIIDDGGKILFYSNIRPYWSKSWEEAKKVHGISYNSVRTAPYPHEILPKINHIISFANQIIGYNVNFDIEFLEEWGISFANKVISDVMIEFAEIYGEIHEKSGMYKWQSLAKCETTIIITSMHITAWRTAGQPFIVTIVLENALKKELHE